MRSLLLILTFLLCFSLDATAEEALPTFSLHDIEALTVDKYVIRYFDQYLAFVDFASTKGDEGMAIESYKNLIDLYNWIPKQLSSEKIVNLINTTMEKSNQFYVTQCGADYNQIKVGMAFSRIKKCVGEFKLQGQVERKEGTFDYYKRGRDYLYVKNGTVVAWGEY